MAKSRATTRIGDTCTGHDGFPPRSNTSGSSDVFVNNIGVHRVTDTWATHTDNDTTHGGTLVTGSSTVFANNLAVGRIGDSINGVCASAVAQGSPNVFTGD